MDMPGAYLRCFVHPRFSSQSTSVGSVCAAPAMHGVPETFKHMWGKKGILPTGRLPCQRRSAPGPCPLSPPAARARSSSHLSPGGEAPVLGRLAPFRPPSLPLWAPLLLQREGARRSHFPHLSLTDSKGEKQTLAFCRNGETKSRCLGFRPTARASGASLRGILVLSLGERGH